MTLRLLLLCASWVVLVPSASGREGALVYRTVSGTVFLIEAKTPGRQLQGSAVAFFNHVEPKTGKPSSTWLATNEHVIRGSRTVSLRQGVARYEGDVRFESEDLDLALIEVATGAIARAELLPYARVEVGQRVFAIGSPLGLENSISEGIVSGKRYLSRIPTIQTTAPVSPGNSGGGLFDGQGRLLGITTFRLREGQNLNFALSADLVMDVKFALDARDFLRLYFERANSSRHLLDQLDWRFVTWLATATTEGNRRRYEAVLNAFYGVIDRTVDADVAATRVEETMRAYAEARSQSVQAQSESQPMPADPQAVTLVCDVDLGPRGRRNDTFVVDFNRRLVNGNPAEIHEDRIIFGDDRFKIQINRHSGVMTGIDQRTGHTKPTGSCKRAAARQF